MRFYLFTLLIVCSFSVRAQQVKRYNFGKPATVESFIKEVIVWEDGKKIDAQTFAGDRNEIFLSDSLIRITEKDTVYEYIIEEVRVDDFMNVSWLYEDGTLLRWLRHRRIFQIEPANSTEEIMYYVE